MQDEVVVSTETVIRLIRSTEKLCQLLDDISHRTLIAQDLQERGGEIILEQLSLEHNLLPRDMAKRLRKCLEEDFDVRK